MTETAEINLLQTT